MSSSVRWHLPQVNGILKLSSFPWLNVLDLNIVTGLGLHQHQLFFGLGGGGGVLNKISECHSRCAQLNI